MTSVVTSARIVAALDRCGVTTGTVVDGGVQLMVPNGQITFQLATNAAMIRMFAQWRGEAVTPDTQQRLCAAIMDLNADRYMPKLIWQTSAAGAIRVSAEQRMLTGQGLSDDQLARFIDLTIRTTLEAFADIEQVVPETVTWPVGTPLMLTDWSPNVAVPASLAQVESVFAAQGWAYQLLDGVMMTSSEGFCVDIDFPSQLYLGVRVSHPEAPLAPSQLAAVQKWANDRNVAGTLGICTVNPNDDGTLYVASDYVFIADTGATNEQLAEWILAAISVQTGNLVDFSRTFHIPPPVQ